MQPVTCFVLFCRDAKENYELELLEFLEIKFNLFKDLSWELTLAEEAQLKAE